MTANTDQDVETLKRDYRSLRDDVSELTRAVKSLVVDETKAAGVKVKKAKEKMEHEIEDHPVASVGVALGIGFLIGILLDRRLR